MNHLASPGIDMTAVFQNPIFLEAVADLAALGVQVSAEPLVDARAYAVIGGRSNARWWLIPLESGQQAASGLALFQAVLLSAKAMKLVASCLSWIGLQRAWARKVVFIRGEPSLREFFPGTNCRYAYFTGTDSPHRKVTIQVMDCRGAIRGFAKVTRDHRAATQLHREASFLERLASLRLRTAHVPRLLFIGTLGQAFVLITDTLKTPRTRTSTRMTQAHSAFLRELRDRTTPARRVDAAALASDMRTRVDAVTWLSSEWRHRLHSVINDFERHADESLTTCLGHGDFTASNTFVVHEKVYVFDWEYGDEHQPHGLDTIHFLLSDPRIQNRAAPWKIALVRSAFEQFVPDIPVRLIEPLLISYVVGQVLRQLERMIAPSATWDGQRGHIAMLDYIAPCQRSVSAVRWTSKSEAST